VAFGVGTGVGSAHHKIGWGRSALHSVTFPAFLFGTSDSLILRNRGCGRGVFPKATNGAASETARRLRFATPGRSRSFALGSTLRSVIVEVGSSTQRHCGKRADQLLDANADEPQIGASSHRGWLMVCFRSIAKEREKLLVRFKGLWFTHQLMSADAE